MAGNFDLPRTNFGQALDALGTDISNGLEKAQLSSAFSSVPTLPDGQTPDFTAMGRRIMGVNPELGIKLMTLGVKPQHEWAVNPLTGEYYDKGATAAPAAAPSYDAGQESPETAGMSPAEALAFKKSKAVAAGKLAAQQPQKDLARKNVSDAAGSLVGLYTGLKQEGALVDPNNPDSWQNVRARLGASGLGQLVEGAIGTNAQQYRDQINTIRPILINSIRQATNQGARGLDSNVELAFYLQQATDTTKGYKTNLAAIDRIDRAYGLGGVLEHSGLSPAQIADIRGTKLSLPSGVKETKLDSSPVQPQTVDEGAVVYDPQGKPYKIQGGKPVPMSQ